MIREKSYRFALRAVRLSRGLRALREYDLARQFLRSATSVGANVEEAQCGASHRDFVAKMGIASKEAREAFHWLRLIRDAGVIDDADLRGLLQEAEELVRLLTAIVKTGQQAQRSAS